MGTIKETRYKENFEYDILFIQGKLMGDIKTVFTGFLSQRDKQGYGGLSAYALKPLLKNRVFLIAGISLDTNQDSIGGYGLQFNFDRTNIFITGYGHRNFRGGFIFNFLDGMFHAGANYEQKRLGVDLQGEIVHRAGILFGFAVDDIGVQVLKDSKIIPGGPPDE